MAEEAGVTKTAAEKAFSSIIEAVAVEVKAGRNINLPGLGSFSLSKRKARKGRNPRTGEPIKIPASKSVKFKPGKTLKEAVK
jgi:DNA-binding protein HU-beta